MGMSRKQAEFAQRARISADTGSAARRAANRQAAAEAAAEQARKEREARANKAAGMFYGRRG